MKNKIAWQKYEDYIEKQLTSPVLSNILQNIASLQNLSNEEDDDEEDDEDYLSVADGGEENKILSPILPITNQVIEDVSMLAIFDCWVGHTNFDLTVNVKNILDKVPGVEVLKILTRYRFFIGVGKLFDFKEVRKEIEDTLL